MKLDAAGLKLLIECEGLRLNAYQCSKGVWTIGLGNTFYEDGKPVKKGDKITKERAFQLFWLIEPQFSKPINEKVKVDLSQGQFNALFIFAWNVGPSGFKNSDLLKYVNAGCNDTLIEKGFLNWKGKDRDGDGDPDLLTRRQKEIKEWKRN